jgi:hypothetical protein
VLFSAEDTSRRRALVSSLTLLVRLYRRAGAGDRLRPLADGPLTPAVARLVRHWPWFGGDAMHAGTWNIKAERERETRAQKEVIMQTHTCMYVYTQYYKAALQGEAVALIGSRWYWGVMCIGRHAHVCTC